MKKQVLLFFALLCPLFAWAQGGFIPQQTAFKNANGQVVPIPNATITVCAAGASGIPCSPALAGAVFKDAALTQPLGNPFAADGNGNYQFAIASGNYTVSVSGAGVTGNSSQVSVQCAGACTFTTLTLTSAAISGNLTATTGQNTLSAYSFDNVVWVDGIKYTTIASAYASITTGVVMVPPNYTETFTANFTMKRNAGIHFMGPATITMNGFQVIIPQGEDGAFITSERIDGNNGNSTGVRFISSGSTNVFQVGSGLGNTRNIYLKGFKITLGATNATGLFLNSVQNSQFEEIGVDGSNSTGQVGIICDGTFNFCGDNIFIRPNISAVLTGITLQNSGNANVIVGMSFQGQSASATGISITNGSGNSIIGADLEQLGTGVNISNFAQNFGNRISMYGQGNTTDFVCGAGATGNILDNVGATNAAQVTNTGCTNTNTVINQYRSVFSLGRIQTIGTTGAPTCTVTGAGTTATCSVIAGSTDSFGLVRIASSGTGQAASGTLTLTMGTAFPNFSFCQFSPANGVNAWNARAEFQQNTYLASAPVIAWDNNAVLLVAANSYDAGYVCHGQ